MAIRFPLPTTMASQHKFSQVPQATIERSVLDRSSGHKTTFNAGYLVPIFVDEVLPGDTYKLNVSALIRLTTPVKPVMDNMYCDLFWFFVPYRLCWSNWERFNGAQDNPGDSTSFTIPVMTTPFVCQGGSIADYMGVMPHNANGQQIQSPNLISALPNRAFWLIYNQWFRDENLVNSRNGIGGSGPVGIGNGPDAATDFANSASVPKRGKRHDYFTSCLPFLQKGLAINVGLTGQLPVKTLAGTTVTGAQQGLQMLTVAGGAPANNRLAVGSGVVGTSATAEATGTSLYPSNLYADAASGFITVSALRLGVQLQKMAERDARGGTRYTEILQSHFKVTSPDSRLQRPEYLGGSSTPITISPVVQVSGTGITAQATPQANLAGVGAGAVRVRGFTKSFVEHGVIIGIVNVRADLTYQSGLERMWSRQFRTDFFWPVLAHLSEQAVLNQEIWFDAQTANFAQDQTVFGYQERYAEYRYKPSRISGQMRSYAAAPFDIWHLAEKFAALPTLAQTFIEDQTHGILSARINAVNTEPDFYGDFYFHLINARPMPVYSVPGLMDHF